MGLIWGILLSMLGVVGVIFIPVTARVLGDDVKELLPWITKRLFERAVSRLPEGERDRFEEEWWAHLNELPGNLAKVYTAWGYLSASKAMNRIALSGDTTRLEEAIRRAIDLTISIFLLAYLLPLTITIAIWIKLDSRGPVLVKLKRLGTNNLPFYVLNFRSTYMEVPSRTEPRYPRMTRVGRFIRMSRCDELLQLVNVLRGEMSLRPLLLPTGSLKIHLGRELPSVGVVAIKFCAVLIGLVLAIAFVTGIMFAVDFALAGVGAGIFN